MTPFERLVQLRSALPDFPTPAQKGAMLNQVAFEFQSEGMALLGKEGGNNCPTPGGQLISTDYLVHVPSQTGHDVLTGHNEQDAIPVEFEWGPGPEDLSEKFRTGERTIVMPEKVIDVPIFAPTTPAPTGGVTAADLATLKAEILAAVHVEFEQDRERFERVRRDLEAAVKTYLPAALAALGGGAAVPGAVGTFGASLADFLKKRGLP